MKSFYSDDELHEIGFKSVGKDVQISRKASFYGVKDISIGNNVRIDDFCVLSAGKHGIHIGNYVHIAIYCSLQGEGKISIHDFVGLSARVSVFSSNDDYFGKWLTNPTVPSKFTGVTHADVVLEKHVLVGSGSVILPGVIMHEGSVLGALSLSTQHCEAFYIYKGNPATKLMKRSRNLLKLESDLLNSK